MFSPVLESLGTLLIPQRKTPCNARRFSFPTLSFRTGTQVNTEPWSKLVRNPYNAVFRITFLQINLHLNFSELCKYQNSAIKDGVWLFLLFFYLLSKRSDLHVAHCRIHGRRPFGRHVANLRSVFRHQDFTGTACPIGAAELQSRPPATRARLRGGSGSFSTLTTIGAIQHKKRVSLICHGIELSAATLGLDEIPRRGGLRETYGKPTNTTSSGHPHP